MTGAKIRGTRIHNRAGETEAVEGVVIVDGPDGVALTLTPGAAAAMSRRLARSASKAHDQIVGRRRPPKSTPERRD